MSILNVALGMGMRGVPDDALLLLVGQALEHVSLEQRFCSRMLPLGPCQLLTYRVLRSLRHSAAKCPTQARPISVRFALRLDK